MKSCGEAGGGPAFLTLPGRRTIAYRATAGRSPSVLFLGGFASDMNGIKATALEAACRGRGLAFVRFDYSGHGASSGRFVEGTIGAWAEDALAVIDNLTRGSLVLVGSSMGAWLMVKAAIARPQRVVGMIGVASAPDFTEDLLWARLSEEQRQELQAQGHITLPSPYDSVPTPISRSLVEEARQHLLLRGSIPVRCPTRLLHGLSDAEVPWQTSLRLAQALDSRDVTLTLLKGADHRLSDSASMEKILEALDELTRP